MKSFSQRTKESLLSLDVNRKCCRFSELLGIVLFAGRMRQGELKVVSELEGTVKRVAELLKQCFGTNFDIQQGKGYFFCIVSEKKIIDKMFDGGEKTGIPKGILTKECCRSAFLRGAFLGGGTVVDPNKNYNMEFLIPNENVGSGFMCLVDELGLGFKKTLRKGCIVTYVKNSESIGDTLAYMGAFSAQMELLNIKIEKELRNDMNRVANSETANMDKVLTASAQQISAIRKIEENIGLENIPDELREVAMLRSKHKDISLEKLGKMITPPLSKSGVNHRIKKIMSIAEDL